MFTQRSRCNWNNNTQHRILGSQRYISSLHQGLLRSDKSPQEVDLTRVHRGWLTVILLNFVLQFNGIVLSCPFLLPSLPVKSPLYSEKNQHPAILSSCEIRRFSVVEFYIFRLRSNFWVIFSYISKWPISIFLLCFEAFTTLSSSGTRILSQAHNLCLMSLMYLLTY